MFRGLWVVCYAYLVTGFWENCYDCDLQQFSENAYWTTGNGSVFSCIDSPVSHPLAGPFGHPPESLSRHPSTGAPLMQLPVPPRLHPFGVPATHSTHNFKKMLVMLPTTPFTTMLVQYLQSDLFRYWDNATTRNFHICPAFPGRYVVTSEGSLIPASQGFVHAYFKEGTEFFEWFKFFNPLR